MKKILQGILLAIIIVGASIGIGLVFFYYSISSEPKFSKHLLSNDFQEAGRIFGADIDGDSDIDVLGTAYDAGEVAIWLQH